MPDGPLQPFALAMPEDIAAAANSHLRFAPWQVVHIDAYRAYYRAEKRGYWRKSRDPAKPATWVPAQWTKRDPPEWF